MVTGISAKAAAEPLNDFIKRNRGSTELHMSWTQKNLKDLEDLERMVKKSLSAKDELIDLVKSSLKRDAFTYGLGIDFETQGFEAPLPSNPWIPGYPVHGLVGTAYGD